MKVNDIKTALRELIESYNPDAIVMANEEEDAGLGEYFVELVPTKHETHDQLVDKAYWIYIRCHDKESTHLSRLELFEEISERLAKGLHVLDRVLRPENIGCEEIQHVLEIKFKVEFTDYIDVAVAPMMEKLEMEV
jgi:hypothetical protein